MLRRTVGRELFSWLFSSVLVVFYLQPQVSYGVDVTASVVLLVELIGFLLGWAVAGTGKRAALVRAIAIPAILSVVFVLAFRPLRGTIDTVFLALLGVQVLAYAVAWAVVPSQRASPLPSR